jgi:hypothetical protein
MDSSTFEGYSKLVGVRSESDPRLEAACEVIDDMSCSDMLSLLTVVSDVRSKQVTPQEAVRGNRFHEPSSVSQQSFHTLESRIFDCLPGVPFVELSPLQPFGINTALAGNNEKNVIAGLRRSETNADATTALFRVAMQKFTEAADDRTVLVATNVRIARAQRFDDNTRFLPHFKVFGEASVGVQGPRFGQAEVETLTDHLAREVKIIDAAQELSSGRLAAVNIAIGNVLFMRELVALNLVDGEEIRKNTANPSYQVFAAAELDIPTSIALDQQNLTDTIKGFGFRKGLSVLNLFRDTVSERYPELMPRLTLDLGRIAGAGYYRHMAYKITATSDEGVILPLADGGTNDWAKKSTGNKQLFSVTSGVGTELLCSYFLDNKN